MLGKISPNLPRSPRTQPSPYTKLSNLLLRAIWGPSHQFTQQIIEVELNMQVKTEVLPTGIV